MNTLRAFLLAAAVLLAGPPAPTQAASIDIAETTPFVRYTAAGGQTSFAYPWPIYDADALKVYVGDTLRTLTTHYSVTGVGSETGGNVVLVTGATADAEVVIYRDTDRERTSQYGSDRLLTPANLNEDFNRLEMQMQDLALQQMNRPTRVTQNAPAAQMLLPDPDTTKVLSWCSDDEDAQLCNVDPDVVANAACDDCQTATLGIYRVGDYGTTEAAIQEAIDAAEAAGSGIVELEARTYDISTGLTIEDVDVRLRGVGRGSILRANGNITVLTVGTNPASPPHTANAGNVVSDLRIDLNDTDSTGILWQHWGQIGLAQNIHFVSPGDAAIGIDTGPASDVNELTFDGINWWNDGHGDGGTDQGTAIVIDCNNAKVINSTFVGFLTAIDIATTNAVGQFVIQGNRITRGGVGIDVANEGTRSGFGGYIAGNRFEANATWDIRIHASSTNFQWHSPSIIGNYFSTSAGVFLLYTEGATWMANAVKDITTEETGGRTTFIKDGLTGSESNGNVDFHYFGEDEFYSTECDGGDDDDTSCTTNGDCGGGGVCTNTPADAITAICPSSLCASGYENRIMGEVQVGPHKGVEGPDQSNSLVYGARDGEAAMAVRDATNDIETFMWAGQVGGTNLSRVGAKTGNALELIAGNQSRAILKSGGALGITDGITAPGTDASWAQLYVDTADGDVKVKHTDGSVDNLSSGTGGGSAVNIGDCTANADCFTPGGEGNTIYLLGTTPGDADEIAVTGAECTADHTVTVPCQTGIACIAGGNTPGCGNVTKADSSTNGALAAFAGTSGGTLKNSQIGCLDTDGDAESLCDQLTIPGGIVGSDANLFDEPAANLFDLYCNEHDFATDKTCTNTGTAGKVTFLDLDESSACDIHICNGTTDIGSLTGGSESSVIPIAMKPPTTAKSAVAQVVFPAAGTITRIDCSTDTGTATIQFDERVLTTPNTGGTDVMTSTLVCDSDNQQTAAFDNAAIAADAILNLDVDAVASSPTKLRINVRFTTP